MIFDLKTAIKPIITKGQRMWFTACPYCGRKSRAFRTRNQCKDAYWFHIKYDFCDDEKYIKRHPMHQSEFTGTTYYYEKTRLAHTLVRRPVLQ